MWRQNKEESYWKLLCCYIKDNKKAICILALLFGIFALVFHLYHLPEEPVRYAALLSVVTLLFLAGYDFYLYCKKHRVLWEMQNRIHIEAGAFPEPTSLMEASYQTLLRLLNEEKVQAVSQADKKQTELYDYYSLWAHQIKTPIAAMRLLLTEETLDCGKLSLELFKIERYVELVLQYLRMESMSSDLSLRYLEIYPVAKQAVRRYATFFIQKKIKLTMPPFSLLAVTDEKWLEFVLEQIVSNALKYTKEGGEISIWAVETEGRKQLAIQDNGIGIQKEDLPRIFERGFTGYNGRMDKKSTGIGLYLVKTILSRLSHSIQIESEVQQGTKVTLDLSREPIDID